MNLKPKLVLLALIVYVALTAIAVVAAAVMFILGALT